MKKIFSEHNCFLYFIPGIIILIISFLASMMAGESLGRTAFVYIIAFIIFNGLLWVLYILVCNLFIQNLFDAGSIFIKKHRDSKKKELNEELLGRDTIQNKDKGDEKQDVPSNIDVKEEPLIKSNESLVTSQEENENSQEKENLVEKVGPSKRLSSEEYKQENEDFVQRKENERKRLVESILHYVARTMAKFVREEDIDCLCKEFENWCADSGYEPKAIPLKNNLASTHDLRHLVWNVAVRLGFKNGYYAREQARFVKALFPEAMDGVSIITLETAMTTSGKKDIIKIDKPDKNSLDFHFDI